MNDPAPQDPAIAAELAAAQAAAAQPEPEAQAAQEQPGQPIPPSPLEILAEKFPELSGAQLRAVAEVMRSTNLGPDDSKLLASARNVALFTASPAPMSRSGSTATTPTRGAATAVRREPSPAEKAKAELEESFKGLTGSISDEDRIHNGARFLAARRQFNKVQGEEARV